MMTFFKLIKNFFIDIRNRKNFKQEITQELSDPSSKMNMFEIAADDKFTRLSSVVSIPEEYQISGTELDIYKKLQEVVRPMTSYICYELGWAEYILVPEFFHLEDPSSEDESCTYLVIWKYAPLVLNNTGFWYKCIASVMLLLAGIAGICVVLCL